MQVKAMYLGYAIKKAFKNAEMDLPERIGIKFLDLETYDVKSFTVPAVPEWGSTPVTEGNLIIGTLHVALSQYGAQTKASYADFTDRVQFKLAQVKIPA